MLRMDDLNTRARGILDAFQYHKPGYVIAFWDVLIDEDGYIWTAKEDEDVEFLVEHTFLRPATREATDFLKHVAEGRNMHLNPRRVWQVTEQFKKLAA